MFQAANIGDLIGVIITALVVVASLFADKKKKAKARGGRPAGGAGAPAAGRPPKPQGSKEEVPSFEEIFSSLFKEEKKDAAEPTTPPQPAAPAPSPPVEPATAAAATAATSTATIRRSLEKLSQREKDAEEAFRFQDYSTAPDRQDVSIQPVFTVDLGDIGDNLGDIGDNLGDISVNLGDVDVELGDVGDRVSDWERGENLPHPESLPPMMRAVILYELLSPPTAFRKRSPLPASYLSSPSGK